MSTGTDIAISVSDVSKSFILPHQKTKSVKGLFLNAFRRKNTFETQKALEKISFEVKKGEFFGIVGRNGGGKSTLLKLISGIYSQDRGRITVNGKLTPFIELGVGFNPELTGRENVYLNGALLGFDSKQIDGMYDEIVAFAELERFMDQKLSNYSSGMQVRLAFSIAVKANTDILVLDEVLAVGDANFQQKCLRQFREFKEQGKTIILVTHSMEYIEKFCDRAIMISEGKIIKEGNPADIAFEYARINSDPGSGGLNSGEAGNKKVILKDIKLNVDKKIISTGDELIITADYLRNDENVKSMYAALGVYHVDGAYVIGVDMQLDKQKPIDVKKSGNIKISFETLPLLSGNYVLNIAIYENDREDPLHFLREVEKFAVIDINNNRGLVKVNHQWSINEK